MRYQLTPLAKTCLFGAFLLTLFFSLSTCSPEAQAPLTGGTAIDAPSVLLLKVQNHSGDLVDGADVYLNGKYKGKTSKYGESLGTETLILEEDKNEVVVRKAGYLDSDPTTLSLAAAEQRLTVVLERQSSQVKITVKDVYARPLKDAVVVLMSGKFEKSLLTNDEGLAVFQKVPDGSYEVKVHKERYFPEQDVLVVNFAGSSERSLTLILQKLPQLSVKVVDEQDSPLAEVEVTLYIKKEYNTPGALPEHVKYTFSDGVVRFADVELDERYVLVVKKEGFAAEMVERQVIGSDEVVTVELEKEE